MKIKARRTKPEGYRSLLGIDSNPKTVKGQKKGFMTGILYLAPADSSGVINVCQFAGFCKGPCLNTSGHGQFDSTQQVRIAKTRMLAMERERFLACLDYDIQSLINKAEKKGLIPCVRINGTSDLAWLALYFAERYPIVQFYDYTKLPKPELRFRSNYYLTFSHDGNEANVAECFRVLGLGVNVSVVFSTKKGQALPQTWNGYRVVDGDEDDLRFIDPERYGTGVVIGLRAKGRAKKACAPFVQKPELVQLRAA